VPFSRIRFLVALAFAMGVLSGKDRMLSSPLHDPWRSHAEFLQGRFKVVHV